MHDLTLLRRTGLLHRLEQCEAAMLDRSYAGVRADPPARVCYTPFKARRSHPLTSEQKVWNQHLSCHRIVVEHSLAQMSQFQVLSHIFRHDRLRHSGVVAGLVNQRIALRPLKTYGSQMPGSQAKAA